MLFSFLYELLLFCTFLIHLPKALFQFFRAGKYKNSFTKRFGWKFPSIEKKNDGPIIWIHGGSVGEINALQALVKKLKTDMKDGTFVVSTVTETGMEQAKKVLGFCDYHVFLPFDFYFAVRSVLKKCTPDLVILCESDFWYRFLRSAQKNGAVTVLINGKVSERSYKRFRKVSFFAKRLFKHIDYFCVQSRTYSERFSCLGVPEAKISILGNIKADVKPSLCKQEEKIELMRIYGLNKDNVIITIGSSHSPEEELFMQSLLPLLKQYENLRIILVPRHPERIDDVKCILESRNISYTLWSAPCSHGPSRVLIVDVIGVLCTCYQFANLAIVAGSYTSKVGGHNILEPMALGIPTICGPFMHSQHELLQLAKNHNAILQVPIEELQQKVDAFIKNPKPFLSIQENASTMMHEMRGSTEKTCSIIYDLIPHFLKSCLEIK